MVKSSTILAMYTLGGFNFGDSGWYKGKDYGFRNMLYVIIDQC